MLTSSALVLYQSGFGRGLRSVWSSQPCETCSWWSTCHADGSSGGSVASACVVIRVLMHLHCRHVQSLRSRRGSLGSEPISLSCSRGRRSSMTFLRSRMSMHLASRVIARGYSTGAPRPKAIAQTSADGLRQSNQTWLSYAQSKLKAYRLSYGDCARPQ
jgi:hypothetical protein